ncbi:F-box domain-containing protein [Mycena sanguinolenta]|uniref:F-box domain-containing protein n=1 Tax=Mycena sanguinolenta TaxID=230812 RepID=A0A8H7CZ98_9AGAR|nr:F-box domain-containing protein [Mycena sanguinolenta]
MPFEALGEDVLLRICCFCDVSTALAVSAINKALRRIALSKQLWLSLVLDTRFREELELPPPSRENLECLSTEELIAVVKNAVTGPGPLCDSAHDDSSSVTTTSIQIPLDDSGTNLPFGARLLPGARYLLLCTGSPSTTQHTWYLYHVWSARRVWHRLMQTHTVCEVDLVPGSGIARVFFVQTVDYFNTCTLHVEEVDLITGASHESFNFSLDSTVFGEKPWSIMGDFLLGPVQHSHRLLALINWRASTFVFLDGYDLDKARLIPRVHPINAPPATPLQAFSAHWLPLTDDSAGLVAQLEARSAFTIMIHNLNIATMQERLEYNGQAISSNLMSVAHDALHAGAYDISIYGSQIWEPPSPPPPRRVTLMERIGNRILGMVGTARRPGAEARPVLEGKAATCGSYPHGVFPAERKHIAPGQSSRFLGVTRLLWFIVSGNGQELMRPSFHVP